MFSTGIPLATAKGIVGFQTALPLVTCTAKDLLDICYHPSSAIAGSFAPIRWD
jgi:hypothetical protein